MSATTISKDFTFSASHQLAHLPHGHPCRRLHGHNYTIRVELTGEVEKATSFVLDYRAMDPFKTWVDDTLDHRDLNEALAGADVVPTAERLAAFLAQAFMATVAVPRNVETITVAVSETPKTWARTTFNVTHPEPEAPKHPEAQDGEVEPHEADTERYRWGKDDDDHAEGGLPA